MSKTYAIGDLHGRYDLLQMAFAAIDNYSHEPATIVMLGDYIDRGPDSRQVLDRLIDGQRRMRNGIDSDSLICLKGNHEDIMWQTCRKLPSADWWIGNGGGATLRSYGHQGTVDLRAVDLSIVSSEHLDWIEKLLLMHVDKHRVYVHAGVAPKIALDEHDPEVLLWKRYPMHDEGGHGHRHVVHGHDPYEDGPILKKNRTDLDTLAWRTGRLVVGVFDDDTPGGPVDFIEVKAEPQRTAA